MKFGYEDIKFLIEQKQWKTFEDLIQDRIDVYVRTFLKDEKLEPMELKKLQMKAIEADRLRTFARDQAREHEETAGELK